MWINWTDKTSIVTMAHSNRVLHDRKFRNPILENSMQSNRKSAMSQPLQTRSWEGSAIPLAPTSLFFECHCSYVNYEAIKQAHLALNGQAQQ